MQIRIGKHHAGHLRQFLARSRLQRELTGVKENVRDIDDQAARGVAGVEDSVELLQQLGAHLLALLHRLLALLVRGGGRSASLFGFGLRLLLLLQRGLTSGVGFSFVTGGGFGGGLRLLLLGLSLSSQTRRFCSFPFSSLTALGFFIGLIFRLLGLRAGVSFTLCGGLS